MLDNEVKLKPMNTFINRFLDRVESTGNRLPNPTLLFIVLCALVLIISAITAAFGVSAVHPVTGETVFAQNLLSQYGLHLVLTNTVKNFVEFAPVGSVLVAVMGVGIAEHSGLLSVVIRAIILRVPDSMLTFSIVTVGVLSSLAMDIGYVVLLPLAAAIFYAAGRHPLIGLAAAFAGVSGGYSANIIIGPLDAILAGLSTEAAVMVSKDYFVSAAGNYYFILASTLLIGVIGTLVTEKVVARRFPDLEDVDCDAPTLSSEEITTEQRRGLKLVGLFTLFVIVLLLIGIMPEQGVLRDPQTQSILRSPLIKGIVALVAIYAGLCGIIFGYVSGKYRESKDFILGMESSLVTMASYMVLMFFAAQLISYFSWSHLGGILAIKGALTLKALALPPALLLMAFIFLSAVINLFIGSATAKWVLLAPIFVPMLLLVGISPEATQVAFRIGDSSTNIISPLMPYFGVAVAFAQRYKGDIGIGSIMALMLPYSFAFLISWSAMLLVWVVFDWPLGLGAKILL